MALIKVPDAKASWTENAMVKHKNADVGVAVAIPGGLITPVVPQGRYQGPRADIKRDEGLCRAGPHEEAPAARVSGRIFWSRTSA